MGRFLRPQRVMDLKQLEYFVSVVDLGGFSRAARALGVAQPAISRQVRSLEVELRQSLLSRNGRGAVPTEAGKRLLEHARGILQQVERARRDVDESKGASLADFAAASSVEDLPWSEYRALSSWCSACAGWRRVIAAKRLPMRSSAEEVTRSCACAQGCTCAFKHVLCLFFDVSVRVHGRAA